MPSRRYLLIGTVFVVLIVTAIVVVAAWPVVPALANILMLLVGLFAMAALTAFHRLMDTAERRPLLQITFNEQIVTSDLETATQRARVEDVVDAEVIDLKKDPWDVPPEDFLGQDNSLALAKLRIDIERELRRLATSAGLGSIASRLGVRQLANELRRQEILDQSLVSVLDDILPAANQAIHGKEVSTETAATILRLGKKLLGLLRIGSERRERAP